MGKRTVARVLVETLDRHGVDIVYGVPGESYLAISNALLDFPQIRSIVCRHEGGAGLMALADAKLTRKPAVCMVSRGPGATNASIAIHTATHDATPVVFLVGQVERSDFGRGGLQEVDYRKTFSDMAKLVIDLRDSRQISEVIARALQVARTGTPGAVIVVLPEDALEDDVGDVPVCGPRPAPLTAPRASEVTEVVRLLGQAKKPLMILGGAIDSDAGAAAAVQLAERWSLPVCTVFRRLHQFPNKHPNYAGYMGVRVAPRQMAALREADLVLAVGTRLGDLMTEGFKFPKAPVPDQPLVHVYPDPDVIGRVWHPTVGIACDPTSFVEALLQAEPPPGDRSTWVGRLHRIERDEKQYKLRPGRQDGIDFGGVVAEIGKHLRPGAVVSVDAGNFQTSVTRYLQQDPAGMHLGTVSGAMGGGVPGVVAAALRRPGVQHLCFIGDGGFLMNGSELATAMRYGLPVKIFIANNSCYGSIRWHQETRYPGRDDTTGLTNPDFAMLGRAFGAKGLRVTSDDEIAGVVAEALAHDGPVVVDVLTSPFYVSAHRTLDDLKK